MVAPVHSSQAGTLVTPVGSQTPVSVVPVVFTPTTAVPMSTERLASPVIYHMQDPQAPPTGTPTPPPHVIREAPVRTPPLNSSTSTRPPTQSATSVIVACSPTVSSNNSPVLSTSLPGPVVYSAVVPSASSLANQNIAFSGVSTTKPYAIVNAMPGSPQIIYTTSQAVQPSIGGVTVPAGSTTPHPPKTFSLQEKQNVSCKSQNHEVVQTISKKIGDAFNSGNEKMLVAAFEDAWKKFQANGQQYESGKTLSGKILSGTVLGKEPPPPNVEVFSVPGTSSRVNLLRQNPRMLAPKSSSPLPISQVIAPPPLSSQGQSKYVYTAANAAQPQVYLQPVAVSPGSGQQPPHSKVHTSGLFYPPNVPDVTTVQKKASNVQMVVVNQNTPVPNVRHLGTNSNNTVNTDSHRRRSNKAKICARCGKSATYLCSGCHMEWYCGRECQVL